MSTITEVPTTNTINILHRINEEKPWKLDYHDVNIWQTARAAVNYPVTEFKTKEEAIEVAEMLRDIIHADAVVVYGLDGEPEEVLDEPHQAKFFEAIDGGEDDDEDPNDEAWDAINSLTEEQIRANQESHNLLVDTDVYITEPGDSEREVEKTL